MSLFFVDCEAPFGVGSPAVGDMTEFGAVGCNSSITDPEVDAMFEAYPPPAAAFFVVVDDGVVLGCGGSTPPPETPETAAADEEAPAPANAEEAGHDLDVGMEFADEGEEADDQADEDAQEDHGPPPTQTYSPASRMKEDSKAIGESDASE